MAQTVVGIFDNETQARRAIEALCESGISRDHIDMSHGTNTIGSGDGQLRDEDEGFGERISRFFKSLFGDDEDVEKYSTVARTGTIVAVHSEDQEEATRASQILDVSGAVDVDERFMNNYQQRTSQESSYEKESDTVGRLSEEDTASIPVVEEKLNVGKREVEVGAVRIRSRIIEKPVEETVRLREQTVVIERTPVDRSAAGADTNLREGEIEIRKTREVPVVEKEARVVEEVRVRKDVREHDEVVRDTVRRTDVEIDETRDDSLDERTTKEDKY